MILRITRLFNSILTLMVFLILVCVGAYACYALWDNHQVYQAAENVREDMLRLKPSEKGDGALSFEELQNINPDVCAWISMDNTGIDYPVLQGETNLTYINTDVYGSFTLAGSIFLDSRCDRTFGETYFLLYGHHMENGSMFGDLDLYQERSFFEENRTGTLLLPSRAVPLKTLACMVTEASDDRIFDTERWQEDIPGLMEYIRENALHYDEKAVGEAAADSGDHTPKVLVLSTCSSEFTNARTVLITVMCEEKDGMQKEEGEKG